MEGESPLPQTRRLGFRERLSPRPQAVLGSGDPAEVHPSQGERTRNREEVRMAHLPTHLLDSLEERGTEFKVMQELLRHCSLRSTLDVYTQAITPAKHAAQAAVMSLVFSSQAESETRELDQSVATLYRWH